MTRKGLALGERCLSVSRKEKAESNIVIEPKHLIRQSVENAEQATPAFKKQESPT